MAGAIFLGETKREQQRLVPNIASITTRQGSGGEKNKGVREATGPLGPRISQKKVTGWTKGRIDTSSITKKEEEKRSNAKKT